MSSQSFALGLNTVGTAPKQAPIGVAPCWIRDHGEQTDNWLAGDVMHRCDRAVEALYERHVAAVLRLARRVTRESRYAEEVAQEVFATLWREPERFDSGRGTLRNWLLTLAHRRSVDLVRVERRLVASQPSSIGAELFAADPPVDVQVSDRIVADGARAALQALPAKLRDVVVLAYFNGYTQAEIAQLRHMPIGTVKTRTRSALRRLEKSLSAYRTV